jgi:hypothetical protein
VDSHGTEYGFVSDRIPENGIVRVGCPWLEYGGIREQILANLDPKEIKPTEIRFLIQPKGFSRGVGHIFQIVVLTDDVHGIPYHSMNASPVLRRKHTWRLP